MLGLLLLVRLPRLLLRLLLLGSVLGSDRCMRLAVICQLRLLQARSPPRTVAGGRRRCCC